MNLKLSFKNYSNIFILLLTFVCFGRCLKAKASGKLTQDENLNTNLSVNIPNDFSYSINLLCINPSIDKERQFVCKEELYKKIIDSSIKWKKINPDCNVNIWYDSLTVEENALENSKKFLENMDETKNIFLKDIQSIDIVKLNKDIFSIKIPLYFRVDLLKLVICANQISEDNLSSAVFTDITVKIKSKEELYSSKYYTNLNNFGMLNNNENQFLQVINDENVFKALKLSININLSRAVYALNNISKENDAVRAQYMQHMYNSVFLTTIEHFYDYFVAFKSGRIEVNSRVLGIESESEWIEYNQVEHGYAPFGDFISPYQTRIYGIPKGTYENDNFLGPKKVIRLLNADGEKISDIRSEEEFDCSRNDIEVKNGCSHIDNVPEKEVSGSDFIYNITPW